MSDNDQTNILDFLSVIVRWRRMIVVSVVSVCLVTAAISLILPKQYRARAVIYPPLEGGGPLGLSSLVSDLPSSFLGMGESVTSATEFVPVLQSARIAETIAERFGMKARYETETREELLLAIENRLEVELSREQFLTVSYEDETPQLSADITNAFVEELDRALRQRKQEKSASFRRFLETRLRTAESDMARAEADYNVFQQEHMAIDLESQAKSQIESANKLIGELVMLILESEVASSLMSPDNPKVRQLETQIAATQDVLDRFLMGGGQEEGAHAKSPDIFIKFRDMPDLAMEAVRLVRDVEIQSALYEFVRKEYEKARFEEEKETVQVVVLDRAAPPDLRSSPRRTLMVVVAFALSLTVSVLIAFLIEGGRRLGKEDRSKLDSILSDLRGP